jgi:putative component of membrane protein insertase Oxa1/YidC/SpoIIIJ protein YidD
MRFKLLLLFLCPIWIYALPGYEQPWGKDADLKYAIEKPQEEKPKHSLAVRAATQIIRFHQNVLSPVDGPRSHFRPSSSSYMMQAMHKYGFVKGFFLGCDRLIRENDDDWVYRKMIENGKIFKSDPVP